MIDISWIRPEQLIEFELIQLREEGNAVEDLQKEWEEIKKTIHDNIIIRKRANIFLDKLEQLKENNNFRIDEFINSIKNDRTISFHLSRDQIYDKILGGWNGRAAGCLLGKPVEKYSYNIIKDILLSNRSWPLDYYITSKGIPEELLKKYPWNKHSGEESLRENIECMTEDDDLNYTMLNLNIIEKYGKNFSTRNVAQEWLELLPVLSTFTAERAAYKNLLSLRDLKSIPIYRNPYREWIGAMIRADLWGWVSAGNPLQAIEFANRDAALSHTQNGVIGEMFISAAISIAFTLDDPIEILYEALKYIPGESKINHAVNFGIKAGIENNEWGEVVEELQKKFGGYFWVHSINNAAMIAASISFAKGDFEKAISCAVMGGWDTDSDGATVGAIIGTILGYNNLPSKWIEPLNNKIRSSMKGFDGANIDDLAKRTLIVFEKN